eukprot:TRINITY_DN4411_c0_g1_i1.p1 TRINITY_DN4411_c0_g1~~TRINITY_DN4411_c0_g1_i1.p1  ORF type:complete len:221 (+),score=57.85 TRINITY_DN4411_c0_g1_i1:62-724(+)
MAFRRIFGSSQPKKEAAPPPSLADASQSIDNRILQLDAQIKKVEADINKAKTQLQRLPKNSPQARSLKQQALQLLKRRNMLNAQKNQMQSQSFTMMQTDFAVQSMKDTALQVEALRGANAAMKTQMGIVDIDDIDDLYDDLAEMMEMQNEMQEVLSRNFEMPYDLDEADLERELEMFEMEPELMDDEEIPSYLTEMAAPISNDPVELPSVPRSAPVGLYQ